MSLFSYITQNADISQIKFAANEDNTTYTLGTDSEVYVGDPSIGWNSIAFIDGPSKIWTHGKIFGEQQNLSNLITTEQFDPVQTAVYSSIKKGSLGKINGQSLEDGDVSLDLSLYVVVSELPTENIKNNKIYLVPNANSTAEKNVFDEYIYNDSNETPSWEMLGQFKAEMDLSGYLTKESAEKTYMKLSNGNSTIATNNNGSMSNFGNNGQAFNAVRDVSTSSITGKALNAASFGVKLDGTTAFTHKTYNTFNASTGANSGARNTAVLTFSGKSGLRYAKNTGTAADVTEEMYKYVGVIDSPDEAQRVYSATQVDNIISGLVSRIAALEERLQLLEPLPDDVENSEDAPEQP